MLVKGGKDVSATSAPLSAAPAQMRPVARRLQTAAARWLASMPAPDAVHSLSSVVRPQWQLAAVQSDRGAWTYCCMRSRGSAAAVAQATLSDGSQRSNRLRTPPAARRLEAEVRPAEMLVLSARRSGTVLVTSDCYGDPPQIANGRQLVQPSELVLHVTLYQLQVALPGLANDWARFAEQPHEYFDNRGAKGSGSAAGPDFSHQHDAQRALWLATAPTWAVQRVAAIDALPDAEDKVGQTGCKFALAKAMQHLSAHHNVSIMLRTAMQKVRLPLCSLGIDAIIAAQSHCISQCGCHVAIVAVAGNNAKSHSDMHCSHADCAATSQRRLLLPMPLRLCATQMNARYMSRSARHRQQHRFVRADWATKQRMNQSMQ